MGGYVQMGKNYQGVLRVCLLFLIPAILMSCAAIPELSVKYQLPPASERLDGTPVFLSVEDARTTKTVLGPGARGEFIGFGGNLTLSVARPNESAFMIGLFEPAALIKQGFERRLSHMGMNVNPRSRSSEPELLIILKDFSLDLLDRKWVAQMGYEARLLKDGEVVSSQMISGKSERLRIIKRSGADEAVGEIFTDIVNRLNVVRLFEQGQLVQKQ
jgi:hypothetical protein